MDNRNLNIENLLSNTSCTKGYWSIKKNKNKLFLFDTSVKKTYIFIETLIF